MKKLFFFLGTLCATLAAGAADYVKVTAAPEDWAGEYVIVYEDGNVIFDGSLETLDATSNTQSVTISNGTITADEKYSFTIAAVEGGYSIQAKSGKYIGNVNNSNALTSSATALANTIALNDSAIDIVSSGGAYLRYNAASNQNRFRYYKTSSYYVQEPIHLYKRTTSSGGGGTTDPGTPAEERTIMWSINGVELDETFTDGQKPVPTIEPTTADCDNEKVFVGWTTTAIEEAMDTKPAVLYTTVELPVVSGDAIYYAVFATETLGERVEVTKELVYDTWTYSGPTTDKQTYRLFGNGAYVESEEAFDLSTLTAVSVKIATYGGTQYNKVSIEDASGNVWGTITAGGNTFSENAISVTKTTDLSGKGKLHIVSKSGDGNNNGVRISYVSYTFSSSSATTYSGYITACTAPDPTKPTIKVTPAAVDFGSVETGKNFTAKEVVIEATNVKEMIADFAAETEHFTLSGADALTGEGGTFTINCVATQAGTYTATVSILATPTAEGGEDITKNITVTAQVVPVITECTFTKLTDLTTLEVNDKIILVGEKEGQLYSMSIKQENKNRLAIKVTAEANGTIKITEGSTENTIQVLTLHKGIKDGSFGLYTGSGYLYAASSENNYLRTQDGLDDNASFTFAEDVEEVAIITAQGANSHNVLSYNSSANLFSCYEKSQSNTLVYVSKTKGTTAIENVNSENTAMKIIENGQLVIIRDGGRYSILGARLN